MPADDVCNIKEQGSLSLIFEARLTTKAVLLGHSSYREGLARETGAKNIEVLRDIGLCFLLGDTEVL